MLGNDVVDLADPETRAGARHPRFDARVFTAAELAALRASAEPERLRWLLWAAKEAAYKAARKDDPAVTFSPRAFAACLTSRDRATVRHGARLFAVALDADRERVHAVAAIEPGDASGARLAGCERIPLETQRDPGRAVRALAIARVARLLGVAEAELAIVRDGRIPRLVRPGGAGVGDLSLAHHGRFVAFACELPRASHGPWSVT
ncbi:MAG: 4'-phosphopantetheinyl transferase superfamily protein [Thermodesulfobacteriota bacterium]